MVNLPVIIFDGVDIRMCESVESAARAMEPADVREGAFQVFDAAGVPLRPEVSGRRVRLFEDGAAASRADKLEQLLRAALAARGDARAWDPTLELRELIRVCRGFALS